MYGLAQDYTVVARVPPDEDDYYTFFYSDAFIRLSDGTLMAAAPMLQAGPAAGGRDAPCHVRLAQSEDGGRSWRQLNDVVFPCRVEVAFMEQAAALFMIVGVVSDAGVILLLRSDDAGASWSAPVEILRNPSACADPHAPGATPRKRFYCLHQTPMAVKNNRLYFAVSEGWQEMAVISCDLAGDIMSPAAWRLSASVAMPIPAELNAGLNPGPSMRCLEGNVIVVNGALRVLARACIDRYATANLAAVFDLRDEHDRLDLKFTQFYPLPGGNCKFFIIWDEQSRLYWMASNPPANSQGVVPVPARIPGNDRRFMMLWYALDALNWFPAGCVAGSPRQAECFMYPAMVIEGDDLVILSRTSRDYEGGKQAAARAQKGHHDANLLTLHRVRNFRDLAMDIRPRA
ncbi:MAG: sialidase family protein [Kiritimatiellia bacterium]|nr:glycoside hydrolase [Lentisphaerota bacterium]